jgi:hypothetical protein
MSEIIKAGMTAEELAEDTAYRKSLLNPEVLPKTMTNPELSVKVKYIKSVGKNVHRLDYDQFNHVISDVLIPNADFVEVTGEESAPGEKVFLKQTSAYGFINIISRDK